MRVDRLIRNLLLVVVSAMSLDAWIPGTASAAGPPSSTALAIEKGTLGAEALHDGRWEDAVEAFTAALPHAEASGDAGLLAKIQRGLGKAHDTLEHHADALRHYRAYLALNIDEPLKRREVELRVADLERVLRAGLVVRVEAPGARITVDGEVVTSADGSVDVTPGRHVVRVTAPGHQDHEEAVQVDGGATVTLVVRMRRLGAGSGGLSSMDLKAPAVQSGPGATPLQEGHYHSWNADQAACCLRCHALGALRRMKVSGTATPPGSRATAKYVLSRSPT